jgi:hypothetical protein
MGNTSEEIEYMLASCKTAHTLTSWEEYFLESIEEQFRVRGTLTDRQVEILERIYNEKS